jgi:hypothetical protein
MATSLRTKPKYNPDAELQQAWDKKMYYDGNRSIKDVVTSAAKRGNINPALLLSSAWTEGLNKAVLDPDAVSEAYINASNKDKSLNNFPVDGFFNYGLDMFGNNLSKLKKYLPEGFDQRYKMYDAFNEKKQKVQTVAFKTNEDALVAKAAFMNMEKDNVLGYAKKKGIDLSDENTQNYFMLASYNGGFGNAQTMMNEYSKAKDKKAWLDKGLTSRQEVQKNIAPRLSRMKLSSDLLEMKNGGRIKYELGTEDPIIGEDPRPQLKANTNSPFQDSGEGFPSRPQMAGDLFTVNTVGDVLNNGAPIVPVGKNLTQEDLDKRSAQNLAEADKMVSQLDQTEKISGLAFSAMTNLFDKQSQGKKDRTNLRRAMLGEMDSTMNPFSDGTGSQAIFKKGGEIKGDSLGVNTLDGGKSKVVSTNDHSNPMIEFTGKEHTEGGIGIEYGGKVAEVENKELGWIDSAGGLNIFGKLKVPGTNQTFRKVAKDISKQEAEVDGKKSKYLEILNKGDQADPYQDSAYSTAKVMFKSLDKQSKEITEKKEALADYQNLILSMTKEDNGMYKFGGRMKYEDGGELDRLREALGKYESSGNYKVRGKVVNKGMYKGQRALGKYQIMPGNLPEWSKAALGRVVSEEEFINNPELQDKIASHRIGEISKSHSDVRDIASIWFSGKPLKGNKGHDGNVDTPSYVAGVMKFFGGTYAGKTDEKPSTANIPDNTIKDTSMDYKPVRTPIINNTEDPTKETPYGKAYKEPTIGSGDINISNGNRVRGTLSPLAIEQIAPELLTLATNRRDPVQALSYSPDLKQTFDISYQAGRNENQSSFNSLAKIAEMTGNVEMLTQLAAQKYKADEQYNMQEIQGNAAQRVQTYNSNMDLLNDARIKNLALVADQQVKQAQADFNTRAEAIGAIGSMASKVMQNQLENKTYNAYANLFKHYGFDKKGNVTFNPDDVATRFNAGEAQQFGMLAAKKGVSELMNSATKTTTKLDAEGSVKQVTTTDDELKEFNEIMQNSALDDAKKQNALKGNKYAKRIFGE